MDEVLKKRLIGASVLLLAALLVSFLLPQPGDGPELEPGQQSVTIDLQAPPAPDPAELPNTNAPAFVESAPSPETAPAEEALPEEVPPTEPVATEAPAESAPQKPLGTTLKLDSELSKPPPAKPEAKPEVKPEPKPAPSPEVKAETKPESKPEPAKSAAKPAPPPAKGEKSWFVQIGSFSDISNARQVLDRFKPAGFRGLISPTDTAKGTLYRARLGPFSSREDAEAARGKVEGQGIRGSALVQE